jgi:serine/threonine protein kinase
MSFLREADAEPIPGYRLIEPLGHGGFGEVWKCEAPGGLYKAIKFVFGNLNSLDMEGARAEQELKALQRIKEVRHPFVVSLDRIEVVSGELVIVMELADRSLHDCFVENKGFGLCGIPRDTLLRYLRDAAEALDHMNEKHNLQHLDVKPRNLFLVSDRVKVADFGLVKHLQGQNSSGLLGAVTPLYAPPETFTGKITDRSDQYSLAIVYQELLTGQRPFNGKNPRQLAQQHLQEEPDLRALPEPERPIIARALSKDPAKRFPSCMALMKALYSASLPDRPESIVPDVAVNGGSHRKTLSDTMEDILLEQVAGSERVEAPADVDLGGHDPSASGGQESISKLGMTVAQPETGALRPTIILGLGSFGRRALVELRCRFLDRIGDLSKLPLLRFLYIDSDGESARGAMRGTTDIALKPTEVYHLPLQPASHYRRRQLDLVTEWLPREKLYSLPRSLKTNGCRALGRLAFSDHYQRLLARLRREVQQATHPDTLYQAVSQTGMALRDSVPRIYVIASAGGGSSGLLVDLGYSVRRLLQQMRYPEVQLTAMLFCGAPEDPAMLKGEQANIYATLTELNHFHDPSISFSALYGNDGPRIVDNGAPYDCTYLLTLANHTPEARRDAIAHLGSYLVHELTTPLGLRLERGRQVPDTAGMTPFRSMGTYAVWFPRGLLLRLAARRACVRLLRDWQAEGETTAGAEVEAACARILADPGLRPEVLAGRIEEMAAVMLEGNAGEVLTGLLANLEEQSQQLIAQDDPGGWSRQAVSRVHEWLGHGLRPGQEENRCAGQWGKSRLTRALETASQKLSEEWIKRLRDVMVELMELPGRRLATGEAALRRCRQFCHETLSHLEGRNTQQATRVQQAQAQLQDALTECAGGSNGGWGLPNLLFGSRPRRSLRVFVDHLAAFARQCLSEDVAAAVQQFYHHLDGQLADQLGDVAFSRQRMRHLEQALEAGVVDLAEPSTVAVDPENGVSPSPIPSTESFWEAIQQSSTARVVLPNGEADLERAAQRFVQALSPEHWTQLDQAVQDKVLASRGGLHKACLGNNDLTKGLVLPLLDGLSSGLAEHLPVTDVAEVECANAALAQQDLKSRLQSYWTRAVPSVVGGSEADQENYVLLPASESGKELGETVHEAIPDHQLVRVAGQADLMFCREQGYLKLEALQRILLPLRPAYEQLAPTPQSSPHSRFDITDWVPLDP